MGTYRKRVKTKGKRWIKGQSSNSNPIKSTFRKAARNNFFVENLNGPESQTALTIDSLRKHDNVTRSVRPINELDDKSVASTSIFNDELSHTASFKTYNTFASDWSCCTNITFNKLLNKFNLQSAQHKEMLAVLAAVTDVIKSNNGTETTTEYFASLLTTLEGIEEIEGKDDSISAILSLLAMCVKNVPDDILRSKFGDITKILLLHLKNYNDSNNNVIMKSLLGCLAAVLRAQEISLWHYSHTLTVYDSILMFITHTKCKIRKAAQHAICSIIKSNKIVEDDTFHPASVHTAKYCVKLMENCIISGGTTTVLHILGLLKEIIFAFPKAQLKTCCETILKLMTLKNTLITNCGLQTLHGLFVSKPNVNACPPTLNAQMITALYDYQPSVTDSRSLLAWLTVMQEAIINLSRNDLSLCMINLPKLFKSYATAFVVKNMDILSGIASSAQAVITDCIGTAVNDDRVDDFKPYIENVFEILCNCLKYEYVNAWRHVLFLISVMYKTCGKCCRETLIETLPKLAEMRDIEGFQWHVSSDHIFGAAIESLGPEVVIQKVPIQVMEDKSGSLVVNRDWLLPLLKKHIKQSTLKCFVDNFLPMATYFQKKYDQLIKEERKTMAAAYDLLRIQVWSLLPSFCNEPSDITETFPTIAKPLGELFSTRIDLRPIVLTTLRKIIASSKNNENDTKVVAKFAKNYLPILFNMYMTKCEKTDENGVRVASLETIKIYLTIADDTLRNDLFGRALQKLISEESQKSNFIKESILDLIRVLLPHQPVESIELLFREHVVKVKNPNDFKEEKKYYRLLEDIFSSQSESCKKFVKKNLTKIKEILTSTEENVSITSRGPRIRILKSLLLHDSSTNTILSFLPEVVLCCKEGNKSCRTSAFELVVEMQTLMMDKYGEKGLGRFLDSLCTGLVGSTNTISATILALSSAIHACFDKINRDQFDVIVNNICLLSQSKTREIVGPALGFIKVLISFKNTNVVLNCLGLIVKTLTGISTDCKRKYRQKLRELYDRMVRKFGADTIISLVPTHDGVTLARLKILRKEQNRKLRQKAEAEKTKSKKGREKDETEMKRKTKRAKDDDSSELSSDDNDEDEVKMKRKHAVYLKEDEDTIIDFTSPAANKNITLTKPKDSETRKIVFSEKKPETEFPIAPDGRLIICENKKEPAISKHSDLIDDDESVASDAEGEMEKNLSNMLNNVKLNRKRKVELNEDDNEEPTTKYRAGGRGIHRKLDKTAGTVSTGEEFKAKKAKGDMKRKGKPDPFAYIPLSRNTLKRRKKKSGDQLKSIVKSAKKGAKRGAKAKKKKN